MAKRVTLDDVAEHAGVHKGTASRALNERTQHQVNAATLTRVRRAARELGYRPDVVARSLRTASTRTIGIIIPDLMNPIFPPLVRGIEHFLQPQGYSALITNTDGFDHAESAAFDSLMQRRVDGLILATGRLAPQDFLADARERGVRIVMANRDAQAGYPVVMADNAAGIAAAVHHLVGLGHRRITHLAGPDDFSTTRARALAFAQSTAQTRVAGEVISNVALTADAGEKAMDELIARPGPRPSAIVAGNDLVALGVLRSMRAHGLDCPRDVSVVGFNDMPFAGDFSPSLTTVRVPLRDIGIEAARRLLAAIEGPEAIGQERVTITLPVSLIVRQSTGPAPRG
ncbi:LacI family DNA-binding transcriptional regulator [Microbacterium sp. zg-Y818]|uniref:LacI family DNA-binding transcriptional regulator n=1 Tax=unclassified Microbacterium TaxID=2609290 RepID=UPI00214B2235|nr:MULTISPECIES: LacI family DNA-binding transcriptional regulator [unclassified Microbacterium]MCR2799549.1 LacI family transcriptional regulator [Microbacterium sp. zg.Y818]WIM21543.1 LacI family DNA-binding transcriptional regulator [Microbacterium sp. zg-Y818]